MLVKMGTARKLQGEIDRVLKKVQEGVDVFDSIWNKVYDTENANQKEKFEADLKKEIKKLQRYRDQIKTWIQSSEIKEKRALTDARKLIEREMERFKVCEKETKTKAFSKEGLGQQPKTDPREKAKNESRDWLNNMVSDLESQIDSFEAEMEGLSVKKGKTRPPRLTHLEDSISRHKQHITKLELILRLLENDGLSPEEVNDVKEYIEDYVERNQDNFEEFMDVDDLYQSLPLDKLEALEAKEAIPIVASSIVVKEKEAVAAASGTPPSSNGTSLKSPAATPTAQTGAAASATTAAAAVTQHGSPSSPDAKDGIYEEDSGGIVSGKPTSQPSQPPASMSLGSVSKEEDAGNLGRKLLASGIGDTGSARGVGQSTSPDQSPPRLRVLPSVAESASGDEGVVTPVSESRLGNGSLAQQLATPPGSQDRGISQAGGLLDSGVKSDNASVSEGGIIGGRIFSPSVGAQWRLSSSSSFQSQPDLGQYHGRTEIAPDQKQQYLKRLQEHQQGHSAASLLSAAAAQLSQLASADQRPQGLSPPQHKLQLQCTHPHDQQQGSISQNSRSSPLQQHCGSSPGLQIQHHLPSVPGQQQLLQSFTKSQSSHQLRPGTLSQSGSSKDHSDSEASLGVEQLQFQPSQLRSTDGNNGTNGSSLSASFHRSVSLTEDDSKNADTFDVVVGDPGTLAELSQLSRDSREVDFPTAHGMRPEHGKGLGVIGRRSALDPGAKMDVWGPPSVNQTMQEQTYNRMALDAAYANIPSSKDSERPKSYVPRFPASTPASYPQVQAPIIENPALWERLETDVLFLAFYYQQGTFQQYLAARELKKQSWRYHKKYNTWFQRHQEPKVATDEYEQGTYVYFDFHIAPDDFQQGWCQRIKSEFTFEYSYLEDELVL